MTEDSILGYDLYSSALAEILSEPSLNTPITVGLYAKWGSGNLIYLLVILAIDIDTGNYHFDSLNYKIK